MSDSSAVPWSNNPFAPQIPYALYFAEKSNFAGALLGAIFYGIVIVMFFQCMSALFNPVNRTKEGIKWPLVAHTAIMFSFATVYTGMTLDLQSIAFIDNRAFPGVDGLIPPGPLGYQLLVYPNAIVVVPNLMVLLNSWLADGLLLYRCYIIYAKKYWVVVFPCLMYLASVGMGIWFVYQNSQPDSVSNALGAGAGVPYFAISISLNILLTLLIVSRLIVHSKNIRKAMGANGGTGGVYNAIITMLTESSALYAVSSVLFIVPWSRGSWVADIFLPILAQNQVIAPFLITLRVANQSALTSKTIVSENVGSMQFRTQGESTTDNTESIPDVDFRHEKV